MEHAGEGSSNLEKESPQDPSTVTTMQTIAGGHLLVMNLDPFVPSEF